MPRLRMNESALRGIIIQVLRESTPGTEELRKAVDEMEAAQENESEARERVREKLESLPTTGKK